ncbi:serine protease [Bacillus pseudomycoides]|uniref:Serine protease n=1 Tax=Bacillus pseudomycoides TaxID=64104 RepID=A0AA91ZV65_9BACI|nr:MULTISPECIES: CAP domain-containing protein [Bacillus]PEB54145.1 serine protease [Bacillus sp. AFS098217]PED84445.1 serine protease [Bacillus pseudomycoides]
MKKRGLLSVAAVAALTLGVSSLDAQAATVQPSAIKVQNIQQSKVVMKHMNQQELQAYLQSMGIQSLSQWKQVQFQPNCSIPNEPTAPTTPETTTPETTTPETTQPVEQKPAENKPAEDKKGSLSEFEQRVVELTNAERAKQGLPALQVDAELSKVARTKSEDMQKNHYFDHNSPTYGSPFDMMKKFGISYKAAGENIAQGQRTPEEVVQAWMNSEGHRANILNKSFTHIGVGYVENGNYWTQQFITK